MAYGVTHYTIQFCLLINDHDNFSPQRLKVTFQLFEKSKQLPGRGDLFSEARIALRHSMGGSLALKFITAQPEGRPL
jgi:hypothetical protein